MCRMSGCPFIPCTENNLWPFRHIPILSMTSNQNLWLFNPLSSPSCRLEILVTPPPLAPGGQESNLGWWLCNRFSMCAWVSGIIGMTTRGQGSWQPPAKWCMGKAKAEEQCCFPCWQIPRRLERYWRVKEMASQVRSTKVCRGILAAPFRPLNTSTDQPWELSSAHKGCSSKANSHTHGFKMRHH